MGREAQGEARCGGESGAVKALLEAQEIILRGAVRRRFARAALTDLAVDGEVLRFRAGAEEVVLTLGAKEAAAWLRKLSTPEPTLAEKLGIAADRKVLLFGTAQDIALRQAIEGSEARHAGEAVQGLIVATSPAELAEALEQHRRALPTAVLWIVHPKGPAASLKDAEVRQTLRGLGYVDTKICAVSAALTATRYAPRASSA